jgi:CDP-diacylglycerol--glycerol-3-phosphate 3-phosphatidyltransferase
MSLPMILTVGRIVLAPIFFALYSSAGSDSIVPIIALWAVFILIEVSDLLDGHFARTFNQESEIGKVLDPLADSISRLTYFVCFAGSGFLPLWILLILIYRDIGVSYIRIIAAGKGIVPAARLSGKVKAWVYAVGGGAGLALLTLLKFPVFDAYRTIAETAALVFFMITAAAAVWSLVDYAFFFTKKPDRAS